MKQSNKNFSLIVLLVGLTSSLFGMQYLSDFYRKAKMAPQLVARALYQNPEIQTLMPLIAEPMYQALAKPAIQWGAQSAFQTLAPTVLQQQWQQLPSLIRSAPSDLLTAAPAAYYAYQSFKALRGEQAQAQREAAQQQAHEQAKGKSMEQLYQENTKNYVQLIRMPFLWHEQRALYNLLEDKEMQEALLKIWHAKDYTANRRDRDNVFVLLRAYTILKGQEKNNTNINDLKSDILSLAKEISQPTN